VRLVSRPCLIISTIGVDPPRPCALTGRPPGHQAGPDICSEYGCPWRESSSGAINPPLELHFTRRRQCRPSSRLQPLQIGSVLLALPVCARSQGLDDGRSGRGQAGRGRRHHSSWEAHTWWKSEALDSQDRPASAPGFQGMAAAVQQMATAQLADSAGPGLADRTSSKLGIGLARVAASSWPFLGLCPSPPSSTSRARPCRLQGGYRRSMPRANRDRWRLLIQPHPEAASANPRVIC